MVETLECDVLLAVHSGKPRWLVPTRTCTAHTGGVTLRARVHERTLQRQA